MCAMQNVLQNSVLFIIPRFSEWSLGLFCTIGIFSCIINFNGIDYFIKCKGCCFIGIYFKLVKSTTNSSTVPLVILRGQQDIPKENKVISTCSSIHYKSIKTATSLFSDARGEKSNMDI